MTLSYVSVCSGIESASVAWHPLGFTPLVFSEIEPFPAAVLAHRFPGVTNLGDFTKIPGFMFKGIADLLVGGTPCQAFSVAGKRESLGDDRGNLTLEFCRLADDMEVPTVLWENVPGVLTTDDNAFGCFISKLCGNTEVATPTPPPTGDEINGKNIKGPKRDTWRWSKSADAFVPKWPTAGYIAGTKRCLAWRVLDAQYFGVAQRRRRVFVVASTADGADPATVLFEPESLRRDSPPSRETRQNTAEESVGRATVDDSGPVGALDTQCGVENASQQSVRAGHIIGTLTARGLNALGARDVEEGVLRVCTRGISLRGRGAELGESELANTLRASTGGSDKAHILQVVHGTQDPCVNNNLAFPLGRNNGGENAVCTQAMKEVTMSITASYGAGGADYDTKPLVFPAVRKLTPIECERLQGFPDDWTKVPYRNKLAEDCPDGPRYKAIGNSKAVPAVRWLGQRIAEVLACKEL